MNGNTTFTMIKPNAVEAGHTGDITAMIEAAGFRIRAMKMLRMTVGNARLFYAEHEGKPFFDFLVEFMTSGPIVAMMLEKDNAVADFRRLIGATDPSEAAEGTIRKLYAEDKTRNAVHGSDSDISAVRECGVFFSEFERM